MSLLRNLVPERLVCVFGVSALLGVLAGSGIAAPPSPTAIQKEAIQPEAIQPEAIQKVLQENRYKLRTLPATLNMKIRIDISDEAEQCFDRLKALASRVEKCLVECQVTYPPEGSPLHGFDSLTTVQLLALCGSQTLLECVDEVIKDQQQFCHQHCVVAEIDRNYLYCEQVIKRR